MLLPVSIVYVVDDDFAVRQSLASLISDAGWQPHIFDCPLNFLSCNHAFAPSCAVLDVSLPRLNGLDLQKRIVADRPDISIIFITGLGDVATSVQAMKNGAVEFLTKPFGDEVLLTAIGLALERSRLVLERLAKLRDLQDCFGVLSQREREVMALVVRGLLNKQVAAELGISEIGVKAHRGHLMHKMKANSLAALVTMATQLSSSQLDK
jgi:FixJ family two-component response regulator